jgi:serine/threonine protein kinase
LKNHEEETFKTQNVEHAEKSDGFEAGTLLSGKYQVLELLGSGGMGTVYKVKQVFLGQEFALKVLDLHKKSDVTVRRFQLEAKTAAQLRHPNLIEVHDFGLLTDEQPYLLMDFADGVTLGQYLKKTGPLPVDYVVALAVQIAFGVIYAHDKGVVHRDIKPANIMLLDPKNKPTEGSVKIVDFGIAKLMQSEDGEIQALTKTGEIFGSPLYMSPEQCKGSGIDLRSDIYSLGCVMFECLTGSPPFFGDTAMTTMMMRLAQEPPTLKEGSLGNNFPPLLEMIVGKMLATNPKDRYQHLTAAIKDLMQLQQEELQGVVSRAVRTPTKSKNFKLSKQSLSIVGIVLLSCCATALFDRFVLFRPNQTEQSTAVPTESYGSTASTSNDAIVSNSKQSATSEANSSLAKVPHPVGPKYPTFKVVTEANGSLKQRFYFPERCGQISIMGIDEKPAVGEVKLNMGLVRFNIRREFARPNFLSGLTGVQFVRIEYDTGTNLTNEDIAIFEKIKELHEVRLSGDLTSLKPLYNSSSLEKLEADDTKIPASEFTKIKRLNLLRELGFGPIKDPGLIFNALKNSTLSTLIYKGDKFDRTGPGLSRQDVQAISKLSHLESLNIRDCPGFDDEALKKLVTLTGLKTLVVKDCKITEKSLPVLESFKKLTELNLTNDGWSQATQQALKRYGKSKGIVANFENPALNFSGAGRPKGAENLEKFF